MERLNEIKQIALSIVDKYYPDTKCAILTGSQIEPEFVTSQSDIDIVLIDTLFRDISSDGLKEEGFKVDFTRVDYLNLIKILVESSYSSNPVILYMLKNGIIIKDKTGIGHLIQEFATRLVIEGNKNYNSELRSLIIGLTKLKKHFLKKLDERYDLYLLSDFLRLTTTAYLFMRDDGWTPVDGFRQVKHLLLKEEESCFLSDITKVSRTFLEAPRNHTNLIFNYIDKYLNRLVVSNKHNDFERKLIVNLNFRSQNIDIFYKDICHLVTKHSYLSRYFVLAQCSPYKYILKNRFTLIFDKRVAGYDEVKILKELENVFFHKRKRILDFCIINSYYDYELMGDIEFYDFVEQFISYINKDIIRLTYEEQKYNTKKVFIIGLLISIHFLRAFQISQYNISDLVNYLINKWLPDGYAQKCNRTQLIQKNKVWKKKFEISFNNDKPVFEELQLMIESDISICSNVDFAKIYSFCDSIADRIVNNVNKLPALYILTVDIDNLSEQEKTQVWYISKTMDLFLNSLGLNLENRSYFAYVLGKLYK